MTLSVSVPAPPSILRLYAATRIRVVRESKCARIRGILRPISMDGEDNTEWFNKSLFDSKEDCSVWCQDGEMQFVSQQLQQHAPVLR